LLIRFVPQNGRLSKWQPADLAGKVIAEVIKRAGIPIESSHPQKEGPASIVDDVIVGCVSQVGAQASNIGRMAVLAAGLPESVPGTTVDRQCGSSQQAIHFAAQAVMSGTQDIVVAAGVEVMSLVPIGASVVDGIKAGHGKIEDAAGIAQRYPGIMFSQFEGAELVAKHSNISRKDMEEMAVRSHANAVRATKEGRFKREILPLAGVNPKNPSQEVIHDTDEGIRADTNLDGLAALPTLKKGGIITAGLASQICDGAAACLIVNAEGLAKIRKLNPEIRPRARIVAMALAGSDPVMMLYGPVPATRNVLKKANMTIDQMDLYEVNEAFASVPAAWAKDLGADPAKLNVNGGAMALGHPLGGTGVKLMTTLLHELERSGKRFGLQAICEGGGTANATIIEVIPEAEGKKIMGAVAKL
ncbi:acetyl-CoA C-acyltransferase, partial [Hyaloraphidium curvatum]